MVVGIFNEGSGLGDQLFRYITVRTLAEKKGFDWGMIGVDNFKGEEFLKIKDHPKIVHLTIGVEPVMYADPIRWNETDLRIDGIDKRSFDPEINFVEDNTIIEGSFEDDKYWRHNLKNINEWLEVEPLEVPDDLCIIGFRGGEYYTDPDLGLPRAYFDNAIAKMRAINPAMRFQVHTDDPALARLFFPDVEIVENSPISHSKHTNMGYNWRSARFAKYAIIPNSAFFILPRILQHYTNPNAVTIAPRYWARHNAKIWARPACYYPEFMYIHANDSQAVHTDKSNMEK
jgi:hypothetical protein